MDQFEISLNLRTSWFCIIFFLLHFQVTVTVLNATISGPVFIGEPYNLQVASTTKNNTPFGIIDAVDQASGGRYQVFYSIVPGNDSCEFIGFFERF